MNLAALRDWTDIDFAAHELAKSLGVMPLRSTINDAKWVYWTNNPLGDELVILLDRLVNLGFLEKREEPDLQYRVDETFPGKLKIDDVWRTIHAQPGPAPDTWMCCLCGIELSGGRGRSVEIQIADLDGSSQVLRAHRACLLPHLHHSVPVLTEDTDQTQS